MGKGGGIVESESGVLFERYPAHTCMQKRKGNCEYTQFLCYWSNSIMHKFTQIYASLFRAVGDGVAGAALAAPVFRCCPLVRMRIISLAVALKYVVSKDSYRVALSICSSEKQGIRRLRDREAACV